MVKSIVANSQETTSMGPAFDSRLMHFAFAFAPSFAIDGHCFMAIGLGEHCQWNYKHFRYGLLGDHSYVAWSWVVFLIDALIITTRAVCSRSTDFARMCHTLLSVTTVRSSFFFWSSSPVSKAVQGPDIMKREAEDGLSESRSVAASGIAHSHHQLMTTTLILKRHTTPNSCSVLLTLVSGSMIGDFNVPYTHTSLCHH